jgi:hypothetical protein
MSSYTRSVRCRGCGESGHNINGCAKTKEYAKNNPTSYTAQRLQARQEAMQHRKCSYCYGEKHTRRTCDHVMNDMVQVAAINIDFRKKVLETIKRVGLAAGALISIKEVSGYDRDNKYVYDKRDQLALVTGLDMNQIRALSTERGCQFVRVQFMNMYEYGGKRLSESTLQVPNWFLLGKEQPVISGGYWNDNMFFKIISPGHHVMENEDEWTKDKDCIKNICESLGTHEMIKNNIEHHKKHLGMTTRP